MTNSSLSPDEVQFVLALVREAKANGITEVSYKDLKLKISAKAQETGSGPVTFGTQNTHTIPAHTAHKWTTSIPFPE